jgi:putative selenium metabolism protein SsnA
MKIIGHATVVTLGENHRVINDGAVAFDEKKIHAIGSTDELKKRYPKAKVKNVNQRLLMPGIVNTHMHLYSTFARGIALKDEPPTNFVEILERLWWRLDKALTPDDLYYTAMIPLLDAVRNGVTTLIDHHASPNCIEGSLDALRKAFKKCGLRGSLCYEISDRDGQEKCDAGFAENANFIRGLKLDSEADISAMIGLHASMTLSDTTLERAAELMQGLKTGVHIHVAEDQADNEDAIKRGYRSVVDRLHKFKLTGPESIFVHGVHCDAHDLKTLSLTETNVVHNPRSNMNNAVGCSPVESMMAEKINLSFGTDGMSASPLEDLMVANLLHKHEARDPRKIYGEAWKMFAVNGPRLAHKMFRKKIGAIEEGGAPDLVVWDYIPPTPVTSGNAYGHLTFGLPFSKALTTICQGKTIMDDGKIVFLQDGEEEELCAKSRELAQSLWERF